MKIYLFSSAVGASMALSAAALAQSVTGFSGAFQPGNWTNISNAPVDLVDWSQAPASLTLSNYQPWADSGSITQIVMPQRGKVTFTATVANSSALCRTSVFWGAQASPNGPYTGTRLLPNGVNTYSLILNKGQTLGFAVNGSLAHPICHAFFKSITLTVTNFAFRR